MIEIFVTLILLAGFMAYNYRDKISESISILNARNQVNNILKKVFISRKNKTLKVFLELAVFILILFSAFTMKVFFTSVVSNSMYPTFERGDLVLMQSIIKEPKVGDIIMFHRDDLNYPVTHRVLRVSGDLVYTGGDASGPDLKPIRKDDIMAKAVILFGNPVVIKGAGNYFILDASQLRDIGPYGQEYLFYKRLIDLFKQYALAIIIVGIVVYIYSLIREFSS